MPRKIGNTKPPDGAAFFVYRPAWCVNHKEKGKHIMNPTTKKLKELIPNSISLPPDDPIYSEPPGILFTGPSRKPGKKPRKASKPKNKK